MSTEADRAALAERRMREMLRDLIREELTAALESSRPSSVELYQNAKGERTITVKEYGADVIAAFTAAVGVFRAGTSMLDRIGKPGDLSDEHARASDLRRARKEL
jgi:hypothetical protein